MGLPFSIDVHWKILREEILHQKQKRVGEPRSIMSTEMAGLILSMLLRKRIRPSRLGKIIAAREEQLRNRHREVGSAEDLFAITIDQFQF